MKLTDALPAFASELEHLLRVADREDLAAMILDLDLVGRCRCEDAFCASFDTAPGRREAHGFDLESLGLRPEVETMDLDAKEGMVVLDVVDGAIKFVEVIDRPDIRERLRSVLP